jgi:hypothetical protein
VNGDEMQRRVVLCKGLVTEFLETRMTDLRTLMTDFRRPAMLLRAARLGLQDFHRERDLKRLLRTDCTAGPETTLPRLLDAENQLEETRRIGDASYSLCRHIEVLIALMAELRLLRQTPATP